MKQTIDTLKSTPGSRLVPAAVAAVLVPIGVVAGSMPTVLAGIATTPRFPNHNETVVRDA